MEDALWFLLWISSIIGSLWLCRYCEEKYARADVVRQPEQPFQQTASLPS